MKNSLHFIFCLAFILVFFNSGIAQKKEYHYSLNTRIPSELKMDNSLQVNQIQWEEDISARGEYSSTYYNTEGEIKIRNSSVPINYYNSSNRLVPINSKLVQIDDMTWGALDQPYPTYLFHDGRMGLSMNNNRTFKFGKNCKINGQIIKTEFEFTGNESTIYSVIPGVDKEIMFQENGLKYNYIINQPLNGLQDDLVFSEEVEIPKGYRLIYDESYGKKSENGWNGNALIVDQEGTVQGTFHLPVYYDNAKNSTTGSYVIRQENSKLILEMYVSVEWLNDPLRVYPIVIDPIVTGPTSLWTGGLMPSCYTPANNMDSIQITIPGGITVTQLLVTSSYFADPFTPAVRNEGKISFSTDCGTSQIFSLTGAPGLLPGGVYLEDFNMQNPLMCCFPESCNAQSFYLTMNLSRTNWGAGCNLTYIRYDPFANFPAYEFESTVIGKTPESYSGQWSVPTAAICANTCSITGTGYVYYGVPPYTFTHPWSTDTIVQGQNVGCATGANNLIFNLTIPNCPVYCDTINTSLAVPPPTIIDACGNVVGGLPTKYVPIKPTPNITAAYDSIVCSNDPYVVALNSCLPGATISWTEGGNGGTGIIVDTVSNNSGGPILMNYNASAEYNGCLSETVNFPVYIEPLPIPNYTYAPDPIIVAIPSVFNDASIFNVGNGLVWEWNFGDGDFFIGTEATHTYESPGTVIVCLSVTDDLGCQDSLCQNVIVLPAEITAPNVITANNDNVNDLLVFSYLDFYPDNELTILNRWGNVVYSKKGYANDWNGGALTEGTYFYRLQVNEIDKEYHGFFQLVK